MAADCFDIIRGLSEKLLDHVLEQIFDHLDVPTIKNVQLVSSNWWSAVFQSKIWSKWFYKKIETVPLWSKAWDRLERQSKWSDDSEATSKRKYIAVEESLERLNQNWKTGNCNKKVRSSGILDEGNVMRTKDGRIFLVNDTGNECLCISSHNLQLFQVIALPDDCICSCFDADEETAFFGCEDGLIRVVDVATGQQVNQLTQLRDTFVEQLRFSRDQGLLVTLSSLDAETPDNYLLTLWRFHDADDVRVEDQLALVGNSVEELDIDDRFIVVVLVDLEMLHPYRVHVISVRPPHQLLRVLDFASDGGSHHWSCGYLDGLLVDYLPSIQAAQSSISTPSGGVQIVDVSSGQILSTVVHNRGHLEHLRLNSRYIVALEVKPVLNIFDLKTTLQLNAAVSKKAKQKKAALLCSLKVDDFQVTLYGWNRWDRTRSQLNYQLVVLDFFDCPSNAGAAQTSDSPSTDDDDDDDDDDADEDSDATSDEDSDEDA